MAIVLARCRCPVCAIAFAPADELHVCPSCGHLRATPLAGHAFSLAAVEVS